MGTLISIDNGGTLTDFCVATDTQVFHAKTVTTPYDLSKCFFDGLKKVSARLYGEEDVGRLLRETDHIRYSTTVGTNALVERKGPRLGLISTTGSDLASLGSEPHHKALITDLVGERVRSVDPAAREAAFEIKVIQAVNELAAAGASRVVISVEADDFRVAEDRILDVVQRKFPSHLLGAMPMLSAAHLSDDVDFVRRTWTAVLNAFLHPAMERFLYSADYRLKSHHAGNPLLVFRNDGGSARVAKTTAIKTYSSGPRGGMEGARALAGHYGYKKLVSFDVGGTTTDIGVVEDGVIRSSTRGKCEQIEVAFPLADVLSAGVGGSSIIRYADSGVRVGPESVGAMPGPACFARGGQHATITDVYLLQGLLDPTSYFGGDMKLDAERARASVETHVARPAHWSLEQALAHMEQAWVGKIADAIVEGAGDLEGSVLMGFGGAGALAATAVADALNLKQVLIPRLAAVFSAYGINFSDVSQDYQRTLPSSDARTVAATYAQLIERARRDMFAENARLEDCQLQASLLRERGPAVQSFPLLDVNNVPCDLLSSDTVTLYLRVAKPVRKASIRQAAKSKSHPAAPFATRSVFGADGKRHALPVYRVEELQPGATALGPAIVEEAYFTGKVGAGWEFSITSSNDILLTKSL